MRRPADDVERLHGDTVFRRWRMMSGSTSGEAKYPMVMMARIDRKAMRRKYSVLDAMSLKTRIRSAGGRRVKRERRGPKIHGLSWMNRNSRRMRNRCVQGRPRTYES